MASGDLEVLPDYRTPDEVRRGRNQRRVGIVVLLLLLVAGSTGLLGGRTATVTDVGEDVRLEVDHPSITRAGVDAPFRVRVERAGGFDGPVVLAVSRTMLDRFEFHTSYPGASSETGDEDFVVYEFAPPDGEVFEWSLDVRTGVDQLGSTDRYRTELRDPDGAVLAEVSYRMWVVP